MQTKPRTDRARSPWAMVTILLVIVLFGAYWLWETNDIVETSSSLAVQPTSVPAAVRPPQQKPVTLNDLEASAVNISIPSFEQAL